MDFVYGIILFIVTLFILINFASVNISDQKEPKCSNINNYQSKNHNQNQNHTQSQYNNNIPAPINANSKLAINKKIDLEEQTYDYNKYFYV
jgi:hypothetical protein